MRDKAARIVPPRFYRVIARCAVMFMAVIDGCEALRAKLSCGWTFVPPFASFAGGPVPYCWRRRHPTRRRDSASSASTPLRTKASRSLCVPTELLRLGRSTAKCEPKRIHRTAVGCFALVSLGDLRHRRGPKSKISAATESDRSYSSQSPVQGLAADSYARACLLCMSPVVAERVDSQL